MSDYVTKALFEERTDHIKESLDEIKGHVQCIPTMKKQVEEHEKFIQSFKRIGLRILVILAICGLTGASVYSVIVANVTKIPIAP